MERAMSVEEKIKRAEEIYARRQEGLKRNTTTVTVNNHNKKDIKLLKKMVIQIIISLLIYLIIYVVQNNNYIFSEQVINKTNEILSYDINFKQNYENVKAIIQKNIRKIQENNKGNQENFIGGAEENIYENNDISEKTENIIEDEKNINNNDESEGKKELSQEEQDISKIKETTTFIKPIEGVISSRFGQRETTNNNIPKNHTGTDIAAKLGTKILSSTDGEVVLSSEEGDYGKHLKIQIGEVSIIYAHCNILFVKQGDIVKQGQEIAEVGSTGNSTGPHLHFEVRVCERKIDPEKILQF